MKKLLIVLLSLLLIWLCMFSIDILRVFIAHDTPVFAWIQSDQSFDDGGSGPYKGLGYSFDIMGYFIEYSGSERVYAAKLYVFGNHLWTYTKDPN